MPVVVRRHADTVAITSALGLAVALRGLSAVLMTRAAVHPVPVAGVDGAPGHPVARAGRGYWRLVTSWDGHWFRLITTQGYPHTLPSRAGVVLHNAWAFLPAYPIAVRWAMQMTGKSFPVAGAAIALACSLLAAALIVVLLTPRLGRVASVACAVLVMAAPASPIFQMTYSDGPALLVLVAVLLSLDRQRWLAAALLMLVAGFTRPIAAPLTVVVAVAVFVRWRSTPRPRRGEAARIAVLMAASVLATIAWQLVAWLRTSDPGAYPQTEASWHSHHHIVLFASWIEAIRRTTGHPWDVVVFVVLLSAYVALFLSPLTTRLGPAMRTWCIVYLLYIGAVSDYVSSDVRFALLLFPLPAVLIGATARRPVPRRVMVVAMVVTGVAFMTLQVAWIDGLLRPTTILQPV